MNINDSANKADKEFSEGNISSLSESELIEYIQALSCVNGITITDDIIKSSTQAQALTAIYTINSIKKLNAKNTFLTWAVIILASLSFTASVIQICKSFW